jgi:secreted Zn-dependent insulinase-like peptidase
VGHEGPGSILAELKNLGYATGIVGGVDCGGYEFSTACALFTVSVTLTKQVGLALPCCLGQGRREHQNITE